MTTATHRRPLERLLLWLAALTGVFAVAGGGVLVIDPSGAMLGLPPDTLAGTPFRTALMPGILLLLVVGGAQFVAATCLILRVSWAPRASLLAGAILTGWLVVEVWMLGVHWLQMAFLILALAQMASAWLLERSREPEITPSMVAEAEAFLTWGPVAFVGLSRAKDSFSRTVYNALRKQDIAVIGVNPSVGQAEVDGILFYATVAEIPEAPAGALLMVRSDRALEVVEDCVAAGVSAVWFHRGAGRGSASSLAKARARSAGLHVISDLCPMMVLEPNHWLHGMHRGLRLHAQT